VSLIALWIGFVGAVIARRRVSRSESASWGAPAGLSPLVVERQGEGSVVRDYGLVLTTVA